MDNKGFVFTIDAALMLIPIFIMIAAVSHVNFVVPQESPYYNPQDVMNTLSISQNGNLMSIANNISSSNIPNAKNTQDLNAVLKSYNSYYNFTYSVDNGKIFNTLVNNGIMSNANGTVSSATRTYGNVVFRLYMWKN